MKLGTAAAVALAAAAVATGCDDDGGTTASPPEPPTTIERDVVDPANLDARGEMREALSDLQADFAIGLSTGVCGELSKPGQRALEAAATAAGTERRGSRRDCTHLAYPLIQRAKRQGVKPAFSIVRSIEIDGDRAVATVEERGAAPRRVRFVEEGPGGWKVASFAEAEPAMELPR